MKALSIMQPWATLIAQGAKRIETRGWATSYRGPLAIHASKGLPGWVVDIVGGEPQFANALGNQALGDLPRGCIIATCQLVSVKFITATAEGWDWIGPTGGRFSYPITDQERAFGNYTEPGYYAWLLADVRPLDAPVPAKGALGLWEAPLTFGRQ